MRFAMCAGFGPDRAACAVGIGVTARTRGRMCRAGRVTLVAVAVKSRRPAGIRMNTRIRIGPAAISVGEHPCTAGNAIEFIEFDGTIEFGEVYLVHATCPCHACFNCNAG